MGNCREVAAMKVFVLVLECPGSSAYWLYCFGQSKGNYYSYRGHALRYTVLFKRGPYRGAAWHIICRPTMCIE